MNIQQKFSENNKCIDKVIKSQGKPSKKKLIGYEGLKSWSSIFDMGASFFADVINGSTSINNQNYEERMSSHWSTTTVQSKELIV